MVKEANDLNDSVILSNTVQEQGERGTIKFKYTLPSGHKIASEWIAQDNAKKALRLWCDQVRQSWLQDIQDMQAEKRRKAAGPIDTQSALPPEAVPRPATYETKAAALDPLQHAKDQVVLLEAEERHWLAEYERATKHLATARTRLSKWKQIISSFENGEQTNG